MAITISKLMGKCNLFTNKIQMMECVSPALQDSLQQESVQENGNTLFLSKPFHQASQSTLRAVVKLDNTLGKEVKDT